MAGAVVTLLTDFGTRDYFVPSMKAVMLRINPNITIVDITHDVPKFNIARAAFILWACYKYFPRGTIHVAVVDPGVGTERRPLIVKTRNYIFVGPDNGVLSMAARDDGIEEVFEITVRPLGTASHTFHGRDIFAPVAAYLSLGVDPSMLGRRVGGIVELPVGEPEVGRGFARGRIVYVDSFGNAYTNLRASHVEAMGLTYGDRLIVELEGGRAVEMVFERSYGYVEAGRPVAVINSEGFLELAVNMGSFSSMYGVREMDSVTLRKV